VDSIALLASRPQSADATAAIQSLPLFDVVGTYLEHALLQMSEDWFALLGPDTFDDGAGEWAHLNLPSNGVWSATFESFGEMELTHFHRV
jgi:hypothetical protein